MRCSRSAALTNDRTAGQLFRVFGRAGRSPAFPRTECDALRWYAGANAGKLQRHNLAVQQRNQPAHRTHKALRRLAPPVHALCPVNAGDFLRQRLRKDFSRRAAFLLHGRGEIFALRSRDLLQSVDRNIQLAREGFGSGSRRAIFVGDLERRPGDLLANVGLRGRNSSGEHRKAARSGERLDRRTLRQSFALQEIAHAARQVPRERRQSCAREFLRCRSREGSQA